MIHVYVYGNRNGFAQDEYMIYICVYGNGNCFLQDECMIHACAYGRLLHKALLCKKICSYKMNVKAVRDEMTSFLHGRLCGCAV